MTTHFEALRSKIQYTPGMPRLTALVSVYNGARHIEGRIENLLGTTAYERGELVIFVLDAASIDDTALLVRRYLLFPKVEFARLRNRAPLYAAWNMMIAVSKTPYLTNANVDDRVRREWYSTALDALDADPRTALVYGDSDVVSEAEVNPDAPDTLPRSFPSYYERGFTDWPEPTAAVMRSRCVVGNAPVWRRSLHTKAGNFDESFALAGDYEMWLRAMRHGLRLRKLPVTSGTFYHPEMRENLSRVNTRHIVMETRRAQLLHNAHLPDES